MVIEEINMILNDGIGEHEERDRVYELIHHFKGVCDL
jgi:hypothetical protein